MVGDPFAFPESTRGVALSLLKGECDIAQARDWARDLWQGGQEDDETAALALIDDHEWIEAQRLLPRVAALAGLTDTAVTARWVERDLLSTWLAGVFTAADLVDAAYHVWVALVERDIGANFAIYNELGDLADLNLGNWDLRALPEATVREYVLSNLIEDGAFERAGLKPPEA